MRGNALAIIAFDMGERFLQRCQAIQDHIESERQAEQERFSKSPRDPS